MRRADRWRGRLRGDLRALFLDDSATLDDLREAVTMLEDARRVARRVHGGSHPDTMWIEGDLQNAQAALRARDISV